MNLYINPLNGFIVVVACIVGYFVYRRPASNAEAQAAPQPQRDLVGASATAAAAILILAFLFGLGDGQNAHGNGGEPSPAPITQHSGPAIVAPGSVQSPTVRVDTEISAP